MVLYQQCMDFGNAIGHSHINKIVVMNIDYLIAKKGGLAKTEPAGPVPLHLLRWHISERNNSFLIFYNVWNQLHA